MRSDTMAKQDGDAQAVVPDNTNWSEWTYSQALSAVTGDYVDLRALSGARWFRFDPAAVDKPGGSAEVGYQAFGTLYFGASIDHQAVADFEAGSDTLDVIAADLTVGARGPMDLGTLASLKDGLARLEGFLTAAGADYRTLAQALEPRALDFDGKAAHVIQQRLNRYASKLQLWSDRLPAVAGLPLSTAVRNAWTDLDDFRRGMADAWYAQANAGIRGRIRNAVDAEVGAIRDHLVSSGLVVGTPTYTFEKWDPASNPGALVTPDMTHAFQDRARTEILAALAAYPKGDLRQAATWDRINESITSTVHGALSTMDNTARGVIRPLRGSYTVLALGLKPLGAPVAAPPPDPDGAPPDPAAAAPPAAGDGTQRPQSGGHGPLGGQGPSGGHGPSGLSVLPVAVVRPPTADGAGADGRAGGEEPGGGSPTPGVGTEGTAATLLGAPGDNAARPSPPDAPRPGETAAAADAGGPGPTLVRSALVGAGGRRRDVGRRGAGERTGQSTPPSADAESAASGPASGDEANADATAGGAGAPAAKADHLLAGPTVLHPPVVSNVASIGGVDGPDLALLSDDTAPGSGEVRLPGWDGRIGGDGAAGLDRPAPNPFQPGPQFGYLGSGYWPTGQYGPLASQVAGSPVRRDGRRPPATSGVTRGRRSGYPGRGKRLAEDDAAWGMSRGSVPAVMWPAEEEPVQFDRAPGLVEPVDESQPWASQEVGRSRSVVIGRGHDDESGWHYDQGEQQ